MTVTDTLVAASAETIARAAKVLRGGGLVAFPTETVYGLGADATDEHAVARIFDAKGRPSFNPLIVHVPDVAAAEALAVFDERARVLARELWPGPLTLVLKRRSESGLSRLVSAGLDTVAVRAPDHPLAQDLLRACGRPIAAPSANRSGSISPTLAEHVLASLGGRVDLILDGGPCRVGVESTVVDVSGAEPALLRPGGVPREEIEALIGPLATAAEDPDAPKSPGQLLSHYAPRLPVRLNAEAAAPGEALLGFGPGACTANLSASGDLVEAAANLFALLHALDDASHTGIAVKPIPETGLGLAINDRLRRAAAPRPDAPAG